MKEKVMYLVLVAIILVLGANQFVFQPAKAKDKSRWEYKYVYDNGSPNIQEFNQMGNEGWELVTMQDHQNGGSTNFYYVFKRKKDE